ncbi:hypothetical protein, partial [Klebsiella pneumoniae]|uniref:hypothetical protein n=1 Tax=Klebsiella pneumoniae TaxID=573 RepID=UPI001C6FBD10
SHHWQCPRGDLNQTVRSPAAGFCPVANTTGKRAAAGISPPRFMIKCATVSKSPFHVLALSYSS